MSENKPEGYVPKELKPKINEAPINLVENYEKQMRTLRDLYIELSQLRQKNVNEREDTENAFDITIEEWIVSMSEKFKEELDRKIIEVNKLIKDERSKLNSLY